ncbi:hypothetical protein ACP70R_006448 [Stipagrostis hirtigluma subsp. patula]
MHGYLGGGSQRRVPLPARAVAGGGGVDLQLLHAGELRQSGFVVPAAKFRLGPGADEFVATYIHLRHAHGQAHLLQGLRHHLLLHPEVATGRRHRRGGLRDPATRM